MKGNPMRKLTVLAAALASALAMGTAEATLQLSANINGTLFNCQDQALCDTNPVLGQLAIADQVIGGVRIVGSSQFQTIGTTNFLNTSSFQIVNTNLAAATVIVSVSGIDFLGPITAFADSGSGTWQNANGSDITLTFYIDAGNAQGADSPLDRPGTLVDTFSDNAVGPADAFSHSFTGPFTTGLLHSMTLGTDGTLAAWNGAPGTEPTLVGRSQTIITTQSVPEPSSMALLGLGLIGAVGFARKKA